ncbi:hypothetical protein VULLAG_LOCUS12379 [Vulpes lagopus]
MAQPSSPPDRFIFCSCGNAATVPTWEDFLESQPIGGAVFQPGVPRAVVAANFPSCLSGNLITKDIFRKQLISGLGNGRKRAKRGNIPINK